MKLLQTGLSAVALALTIGGAAQAAPTFAAGGSRIFFNNYENLYRAVDTSGGCAGCLAGVAGDPLGYRRVDPNIANNVAVGDIFAGILDVQNVRSDVSGVNTYDSAAGDRFTGYFAQRVNAIAGPSVGHATAHITLGVATDPFGILSVNEMFRLYSNTPAFSSGGSAFDVTANIALATSGTFWGALGFGASPDGYAYTHTDLTQTVGTSNTENFSALNLLLAGPGYNAGILNLINDFNENEIGGLIANPASQLCSAAEIANPGISCTQFVGTSEIEGNNDFGTLSPWMFASNDPFDLNRVPEPGSLALVGLALAGLGLIRRRRSI